MGITIARCWVGDDTTGILAWASMTERICLRHLALEKELFYDGKGQICDTATRAVQVNRGLFAKPKQSIQRRLDSPLKIFQPLLIFMGM